MFKELREREISLLERSFDDRDAVGALADVVVRKVGILNAKGSKARAHRQLTTELS